MPYRQDWFDAGYPRDSMEKKKPPDSTQRPGAFSLRFANRTWGEGGNSPAWLGAHMGSDGRVCQPDGGINGLATLAVLSP
jgi:hypothetical protein